MMATRGSLRPTTLSAGERYRRPESSRSEALAPSVAAVLAWLRAFLAIETAGPTDWQTGAQGAAHPASAFNPAIAQL